MALEYKIVYTGGEAEIVEKKSRFYCNCKSGEDRRGSACFYRSHKEKILECQTQLFCLYCWRAAGTDAVQ